MASTDVELDQAPRSAKWLVGVLFAALLVPGIIGFDVWPLTGWRLFSASRHATDTRWIVQSVGDDGRASTVDLNELPLAYSNAEWPMTGASTAKRERICRAMADAVADARPGTREVRLARDHEAMVHRHGDWIVTHQVEPLTTCTPEARS